MDKIVIFHPFLRASGGSERITLEEEAYLRRSEYDTAILTFDYNSDIFNGVYDPKVIEVVTKHDKSNLCFMILERVFQLRKYIKNINPDIISVCNVDGSAYVYLAIAFLKFKYFTQIPSSGYDNISFIGKTLFSVALFSKFFYLGYLKIRNSTIGHQMNLPVRLPALSLKKRILSEFLGIIVQKAVKKADRVYVLSNQVKSEIKALYQKEAHVLKGAYPRTLLNYKPKNNIKHILKVTEKRLIFSLCRLEEKKRVDWIIKAIPIILNRGIKDIVLLIGGTGSHENQLKLLTKQLNIQEYVYFLGFIPEENLYDYYHYCDIFVSADYADFDITTYTAIAFDKNIVWSIDNELEPELEKSGKIFPAGLSPESFALSIQEAIKADTLCKRYSFKKYDWESYFEALYGPYLQ